MTAHEARCEWFESIAGRSLPSVALAAYTSFRIGGRADVLFFPRDLAALREACELCRERDVPLFVLGAGTNLLVSDDGVRGVVVSLKDGFQRLGIETDGGSSGGSNDFEQRVIVRADGAVKLPRMARFAAARGLAGAEFMHGIPGAIGGAVRMNAGTRNGATADILLDAEVLDSDARLRTLSRDDLRFGYRSSALEPGCIVVSARFALPRDEPKRIAARMAADAAYRKSTQPLSSRSAGSFFINPKGASAGWLIETAGLKGYAAGDAHVSRKHANFLVNGGGASAHDMVAVMRHVQNTVAERSGIWLATEVVMAGHRHPAREGNAEDGV